MAAPPTEDGDWEDWEEWDGRSKFSHHVLAGSCAGVMEHVALFPLDTLRVRDVAVSFAIGAGGGGAACVWAEEGPQWPA